LQPYVGELFEQKNMSILPQQMEQSNYSKLEQIIDKRIIKDFTTITFSGYKKTEVIKSLMKALICSKIELACYWCAELICSGRFIEVWDLFIQFYCKYIHIGNIKIAIYLDHKYKQFDTIMKTEYKILFLDIRNDQRIRNMMAEIICVLSNDTIRKHAFDSIKIGADDFDMQYMKTRFKAPSMIYAESIYQKFDPIEFIVAINELAYHVSAGTQNTIMACYWIEWIYEFELLGKAKKELYECETRYFVEIDSKYQKEITWLIWNVFLLESENRNGLIKNVIHSLLNLYAINYSKGTNRKRKYILYFVVNILCETVSLNENIIQDNQREKIAIVIENINLIYKQIKSAEQTLGNDYLFHGLG